MTNTNKKTILVTGGSGYIAMFIMIALLKKGYRVRATLRTMSRQEEVKKNDGTRWNFRFFRFRFCPN